MSMAVLLQALAGLAGGLALGVAYFALLGRSVSATPPPAARPLAALFLLLRLALAAGAFWLAAQSGAVALIAMLAGFLVARGVAIRRVKEG